VTVRLRLDDLPAGRLRDAAIAGGAPTVARAARSTRRSRGGRCRYTCGTCGERLVTGLAAAERHADAHGGARLDLDLEQATS
jgi:hypothetical protein